MSCKESRDIEAPRPTVYIEEDKGEYSLIRNGEPFYIKGGAASAAYLEELKIAGANTARIYDTIGLQNVLDEAHELGLAVVVDIPLPRYDRDSEFYEDKELFNKMFSDIQRAVVKYKDHPALLYWNLGNEIHYPYFYQKTKFFSAYNHLIQGIKDIDPNHPVSTAVIAGNRRRILSILIKTPNLDFISFNSFGSLTRLHKSFFPLTPVWKGPYVISEWGINGPWEEDETIWGAPIEPTSTKKAEQVMERSKLPVLSEKNSLGSFYFYWGNRQERTSSWFTTFEESGKKFETYYALSQVWGINSNYAYKGPQIKFLLLEGQGALEDIILAPNEEALAEVLLENP